MDEWRCDMSKSRPSGGGQPYSKYPAQILNNSSDPEFLMNNPREIEEEFPPGMHFEHRGPQPYVQKNDSSFHSNMYGSNDFETKAPPSYGFPNYPKPQQNSFDNSMGVTIPSASDFKSRLLAKYPVSQPQGKPLNQPVLQFEDQNNVSRINNSVSDTSTNHTYSFSRYSNENQRGDTSSFLSDHSILPAAAGQKAIAKEIKEESSENPAENTMKAISKNQLNCISLLNEVSSKVKKRVDYIVKDLPLSKVKVFECACVFDKISIGVGKGNSKQAAKNEAAVEGVRTLLTKEEFALERAHVTLSVQKMTGVGPEEPAVSTHTQSSQSILQPNISQSSINIPASIPEALNESDALMNDSALYELNLIGKECFIEPRWKMSPPGGPNGEFEAEVIFDKLTAIGKGRKKVDAKRDAAMQIIQKIRNSKELNDKYNPKANKKGVSDINSLLEVRTDRAKNFFDSCLDSKFAVDTQSSSLRWRESIIELEKNFEDYLSDVTLQYKLDDDMIDILQGFFKVISDHTSIITSNPKQVLLDAPKHLADYVTDCCLVPTGSFALDCMRRDNLSINAMLVFEETKRISEREFLSLYQYSLQEYQNLLKAESQLSFEIDVQVESSEIGDHLVISAKSVVGKLTMQIQIYNSSQNQSNSKYDPSIVHIKRIYDCFEDPYKLKQYREMIGLMRLWRIRNNLFLLPPELLDVILLNSFLNNKAGSTAGYIINCLVIMSTDETFQASLSKCGPFYLKLYKEIPSKLKWSISSKCSQSLESIYKQGFKDSSFC